MYITINDIKGEKTIDLSYPIRSTAGGERKSQLLACISVILRFCYIDRSIEVLFITGKKIVLHKRVYMDKELNSLIGTELKSQMPDSHYDMQRTNKLVNGTKITISLNELNNSDNLEDGKPSKTLFTYFVTSPEYFTHSNPNPHNIKNLRMTQSLPLPWS